MTEKKKISGRPDKCLPTRRKIWKVWGIDAEVHRLFKGYCVARGYAMCRALDYLMEECMKKKLIVQLSRLPYDNKKRNPRPVLSLFYHSGKYYRQFKAYCCLRDLKINQTVEFLMIRAMEEKPTLGISASSSRRQSTVPYGGPIQPCGVDPNTMPVLPWRQGPK